MRRNNLATKLENSVSHIPIENVITHHDINKNLPQNKSLGYNVNYPSEWLSTHSDKKMIGVRRLEMFPTAHVFEMRYKIYRAYYNNLAFRDWSPGITRSYGNKPLIWEEGVFELDRPIFSEEFSEDENQFKRDKDDNIRTIEVNAHMYKIKYECKYIHGSTYPYQTTTYYQKSYTKVETTIYEYPHNLYSIIDENETTEILSKIFDIDVNTASSGFGKDYRVRFNYDSARGHLTIAAFDEVTSVSMEPEPLVSGFDFGGIQIKYYHPFNNRGAIELLKFLNQEVNLKNYFHIQVPRFEMVFEDNVWNRKQAMFHCFV